MKWFLRAALTLFFLFPAQVFSRAGGPVLSPEGQPQIPWEELLDRYESICGQCLELRQRKDAGEDIDTWRLPALMDELGRLREELKGVTDKMPPAVRRRFDTIRRMYASGRIVNTRAAEVVALPEPAVSAIPAPFPGLTPRLPDPPVRMTRPTPLWAISASVLAPEYACGAMISHWGPKWGGYAAVRSNYSFHKTAYDALSDGTAGQTRIWTSGAAAIDRLFVTAGPTVRSGKRWGLFGGLGYGFRRLCWEDSDGEWMRIADASSAGLAAEAGVCGFYRRYTFSVSWVSVLPACHSASVSVGYCF